MKQRDALATELRASKQALHGEREAGRVLERKVDQLQAVESRVAVLEAQLAENRTKAAEAEQASGRVAEFCNELRRQKTML